MLDRISERLGRKVEVVLRWMGLLRTRLSDGGALVLALFILSIVMVVVVLYWM